jgi:hypothetical protein
MRISGFNFSGSVASGAIWLYGKSNIEQLRIDHNKFSIGSSQIAILLGESSGLGNGNIWGVIDHNTFTATNSFMGVKVLTGGQTWTTGLRGTSHNIFIEDNTYTFSNYSDLGTGGIDAWMATGVVFRFNTMTNARYVNHSLCHNGPASVEMYGNTINAPNSVAPNYRNIHFQGGGETILFNNIVYGGHIALQHFRSDASQMPEGACTAATVCNGTQTGVGTISDPNDGNRSGQNGYPCWHQPGRDGAGTLKPIYQWQNRNQSGSDIRLSLESSGYMNSHVKANRDFYEAVSTNAQTSPTSPFNGTVGMGFGTLANRPSTCTTGPEALDSGKGGVGYWATDQGEWDSTHPGADGQLYICSAANTWTLYYTPYTYPHPLQSGGGGGNQSLASPTNLTVVTN